jgi:hypothetical protein
MSERLSMIEQWKRARRASVPIVAIETVDQQATRQAILSTINGSGVAVVDWDILRGVRALNNVALSSMSKICNKQDPESLSNPAEMLLAVTKAPERTIVFMSNAHRYFTGDNAASVVQGIANIRDEYKATGATLVLLTPNAAIPIEIAQDVMIISDPLPTVEQITTIIDTVGESAGMERPDDIEKLADMLIGLSAFSVEQTVATCIFKDESGVIDIDRVQLRMKKNKAIEQTKGLTIYSPDGAATWDNLYDLDNLKFDLECIAGNFNGVLFVDKRRAA